MDSVLHDEQHTARVSPGSLKLGRACPQRQRLPIRVQIYSVELAPLKNLTFSLAYWRDLRCLLVALDFGLLVGFFGCSGLCA